MRIRRLPAVALTLALLVTSLSLQAAQATHISAGELLPDLGMNVTRRHSIETVGDQTRLRFTTVIINIGDGPFQVRGSSPPNGEMPVDQQIFNADGTKTTTPTNFRMIFGGDGHNHWHVRDLATYELQNTAATIKRTGEKRGFCFFDNE
ncbi:MAG: hypothetical protein ACR2GO_08250, partial [Candidatus Limnocylindria bacterium]